MAVVRGALAVVGALAALAIVAGAVAAYLTFGVPRTEPSSGAPPMASAIVHARSAPDAPAAFRDRAVFRSCGDAVLAQGDPIPADRIACLVSAPDSGRELAVVSPTTEGDPLVRWFRVGPGIPGVEVWEDATADRFGGGWHRTLCRSARIDQFGACA